ncbi:MAG: sulfatase-like hydrolase/transferase [Desulfomonilaceae bacterium]
MLFLWVSSLAFASLFELQRYEVVGGPKVQGMTIAGTMLLLWVLTAKSLSWFLPFLPLWALLIRLRCWRVAVFTLNFFWVVMFYFMALDLVSVSFAGYHLWDYLPNVEDFLKHPEVKVWQWAGGQLTAQAFSIFLFVAIFGPLLFYGATWAVAWLAIRFSWMSSPRSMAAMTLCFALSAVAPVTIGGSLPERVLNALPVSDNMKSILGCASNHVAAYLGLHETPVVRSELLHLGGATATSVNRFFPRKSNVVAGRKPGADIETEANRLVRGQDRPQSSLTVASLSLRSDDEQKATEVLQNALDPPPIDDSAFVTKEKLPNVILIIFESFRYFALGPELMKDLDAWSQKGLRLQRHYSGSNCSHLGLFSLFYSRIPLGYHKTLDRKIPPQMLESLRRSGYEITFLTAGETRGFRRIEEFLNNKTCDHFAADSQFSVNSMEDWPDSDRRKLARVKNIVNNASDRPQFVFFYLISSHYRYAFPPEFALHQEASHFWNVFNPTTQVRNHLNRYANALLFLEREVLDLTRTIDPNRNIIIITGDHGESMGEDGVFTHGSRMSEIQMRVPFAMVGPGVEPRVIRTATSHFDVLPTLLHALAGRHVPVQHSQGRDLLAEPSPADEVFVVPANGPDWDRIMLIRADKRLLFRPISEHGQRQVMKFEGMVDEVGDYTLKVSSMQDSQKN